MKKTSFRSYLWVAILLLSLACNFSNQLFPLNDQEAAGSTPIGQVTQPAEAYPAPLTTLVGEVYPVPQTTPVGEGLPAPQGATLTSTEELSDIYPPAATLTATQPQTQLTLYPGPESQFTLTPDLQSLGTLEPTSTHTITPTPALNGQASPTSTSTATQEGENLYPGPIDSTEQIPAETLTPTPTESPVSPDQTTPTVPSGTAQPTQTSTPGITPTLGESPTFTPTITSTPTRTPVPPPPWIEAQLYATDPETVQLASGKVQLIFFFAFWDGACQAMAPLVHGLELGYAGQVIFTYLDIDDPATLIFQKQLFFRNQPHFFLLDPGGMVLKQWVGYVGVQDLIRAIEDALN